MYHSNNTQLSNRKAHYSCKFVEKPSNKSFLTHKGLLFAKRLHKTLKPLLCACVHAYALSQGDSKRHIRYTAVLDYYLIKQSPFNLQFPVGHGGL